MHPEQLDLHALESAAFAAWPALQDETCHGWLLRDAQGYTKRANSANALPGAAALNPAQLRDVETRFQARGLPSIFRLASFAVPDGVDSLLADAGYRWLNPSWVMAMDLHPAQGPDGAVHATGWASNAPEWLGAFQIVSGKLGPDQAIHLQLLQAIQAPCAFALNWEADQAVCCGLAVLVEGRLGLFDIATAPAHRRRGLAKALCQDLLAWGRRHGAHTAYLQVTAGNVMAIRLYEALGFRLAYTYGYRVAP